MTSDLPLWSACVDLYFPRNLRIRSPETKRQYRIACDHYGRHLGKLATIADLSDDPLLTWQSAMLARNLSAFTVRERAGRIVTLWTWLAKRGVVSTWPTVQTPDVPVVTPVAMREADLRRLFKSAAKERGKIAGVPADLWWTSFLAFVWSTAERRAAALAVRREWIDFEAGVCHIPAAARKGGKKPATHHLWPEVLGLIRQSLAHEPDRELVWPWPWCDETYWNRLAKITVDAGWPNDRRHKTHCLRVSHATWLKVLGGDPTRALLHGDSATTQRHYLDPRLQPPDPQRLFVPWAG